ATKAVPAFPRLRCWCLTWSCWALGRRRPRHLSPPRLRWSRSKPRLAGVPAGQSGCFPGRWPGSGVVARTGPTTDADRVGGGIWLFSAAPTEGAGAGAGVEQAERAGFGGAHAAFLRGLQVVVAGEMQPAM